MGIWLARWPYYLVGMSVDTPSNPPAALTFRFPWRDYQARILERLELYREDRKIHVVAPPGAGKTVLGLEIMRRLGKRSLVLAPSLTIRAQWTERYVNDFGADEALISNDLYAPGEITIVTYQAMFAYNEKMGTEGLDWVEALVVDECHHLRREWWRVLDEVMKRYQPELVALTATPPYDVSGVEWRRYHSFCGEIDEEISIPELVASGDLCPHQDFLYPILPPPGESRLIDEWQERKEALLELAHTRSELAYTLRLHPWLADPESHYEAIFEQPEYFTALLSMLRAQGSEPPASALGVLHGEATLAPALDDYWLGLFLQQALREDNYFSSAEAKELLKPYRRGLTTMGAWQDGKLHFDSALPPASGAEAEQLESPQAKLDALTEIAAFESDALLDDLRMVILTDNIYDEYLPTTEHDRRPIVKVGTVPVFETLRRQEEAYYRDKLCVLTGLTGRHSQNRRAPPARNRLRSTARPAGHQDQGALCGLEVRRGRHRYAGQQVLRRLAHPVVHRGGSASDRRHQIATWGGLGCPRHQQPGASQPGR